MGSNFQILKSCTTHDSLDRRKALPVFFLRIFGSLTCLKKRVFSKGTFCGGKYQPDYTGNFWPGEGTSQPIAISKKWKNPSSPLHRKRTGAQALSWFSTFYLSLPAWGHKSQIMERPVPIQSTTHQSDRKTCSDFLTIIKGIVSTLLFPWLFGKCSIFLDTSIHFHFLPMILSGY
jgi:hypothetical protein